MNRILRGEEFASLLFPAELQPVQALLVWDHFHRELSLRHLFLLRIRRFREFFVPLLLLLLLRLLLFSIFLLRKKIIRYLRIRLGGNKRTTFVIFLSSCHCVIVDLFFVLRSSFDIFGFFILHGRRLTEKKPS